MDGFLLKPVNPSVLFDAIMHAFGREVRRSSRAVQEDASGLEALSRIRGAQVLLVEDNEINQQVASEILAAAGLQVFLANNGQEKEETKGEFEAGLALYYDRMFSEASVKFSQVLQKNPEDKAARIYLERCALYMVKGVPEDWTGVEILIKK